MLAMNKLKVKSMFYSREEEMSDEKKDVLRRWMLNVETEDKDET